MVLLGKGNHPLSWDQPHSPWLQSCQDPSSSSSLVSRGVCISSSGAPLLDAPLGSGPPPGLRCSGTRWHSLKTVSGSHAAVEPWIVGLACTPPPSSWCSHACSLPSVALTLWSTSATALTFLEPWGVLALLARLKSALALHCCVTTNWPVVPPGCVALILAAHWHTWVRIGTSFLSPLSAHTSGTPPRTLRTWQGHLPIWALHPCSWPTCYLSTPIGSADRSTSLLQALGALGSATMQVAPSSFGVSTLCWRKGRRSSLSSIGTVEVSPPHSQSTMMAKQSTLGLMSASERLYLLLIQSTA